MNFTDLNFNRFLTKATQNLETKDPEYRSYTPAQAVGVPSGSTETNINLVPMEQQGDFKVGGEVDTQTLKVNGAVKTAVVPTSKGYNALYCVESPEVWFMDFCNSEGSIDPLFLEVTVGPYKFIECKDGSYQVWGKRKGFEDVRLEEKTLEEFDANEQFLNMNKPIAKSK